MAKEQLCLTGRVENSYMYASMTAANNDTENNKHYVQFDHSSHELDESGKTILKTTNTMYSSTIHRIIFFPRLLGSAYDLVRQKA